MFMVALLSQYNNIGFLTSVLRFPKMILIHNGSQIPLAIVLNSTSALERATTAYFSTEPDSLQRRCNILWLISDLQWNLLNLSWHL